MLLKARLLSLFSRNPFAPRLRDVRQGEMAECGLAALASLMSAYGAVVPLDRLRAMAASTLYGTSLRTLRAIAIQIGFDARAQRVEAVADLAAMTPCLVHLNFIHFAVVEEVTKHEVVLSDPLAGPTRVPIDSFSRAFTGVALTLRPTPFLQRTPGAPVPSRRAWLVTVGRGLPVALAAAAGSVGALAIAAIGAGARIDGHGGLALPLLALAAAWVLGEVAIRRGAGAVAGTAAEEQAAAIDHVADRPAADFVLRSPLQANALLGAPGALIDPVLLDGLLATAAAAALLIGAVVATPIMAGAGALILGIEAAVSAAIILRRGAAVPHLRWQAMPVRTPYAGEFALADGWGLGRGGEALFHRLAGDHAGIAAATMSGAERGAVLAGLRAGFAGVRLFVLLLIGAVLLRGGAGLGAVFASGVLVMMAGSQLGRIAAALRTPGLTGALHRLADRPEPAKGACALDPLADAALVLDDVAWRPAEMLPDVVQGISFAVPVRGSLAILAPPRSGATTIARLAASWLMPSKGTVRAGSAILLATHWPFAGGKLRDLLSVGADFSDAAMLDMIDVLGLTPALIPRGGLELTLSEDASEISGGQRRRLMLAAALLRRPDLLVLDGTLDAVGTASAAEILALCKVLGTAVLLTGHRDDIADLCDARYALAGAAA